MNVSRASLNLYLAGDLPYDPVALAPLLIADLIALYKERDAAEPKIVDQGIMVPEVPLTGEQYLRILNKKQWYGTFNSSHKYDECYIVIDAETKEEAMAKMNERFSGQWDSVYDTPEAAGIVSRYLCRLS